MQNIVTQIKKNKVVLMPTDTVYGICCLCENEQGIKKILKIKESLPGRGFVNISHSLDAIKHIVDIEENISKFLPENEPTTIIFEKFKYLPAICGSGDGSIAFRIIKKGKINTLLKSINKPLLTSSANFKGHKTPTNYNTIDKNFMEKVDYISAFDKKIELEMTFKPSKIIKIKKQKIFVIRE